MEKNQQREPISVETIKANLARIREESIPIWRRKSSGEWGTVPPDRLDQFIGKDLTGRMQFFIETNWKSKIEYAASAPPTGAHNRPPPGRQPPRTWSFASGWSRSDRSRFPSVKAAAGYDRAAVMRHAPPAAT